MKKIIAIDLDGTLLNDDLNIIDESIKSLNLASNKGYKIVICTGRPLLGMKRFLKIINKDENIVDYLVLLNGASIYSLKDKECLKSSFLEKNILRKSLEFIDDNNSYNINLVGMNDNEFITRKSDNLSREIIIDANKNKMEIKQISDLQFLSKKDINKLFYIGDSCTMDLIQSKLEDKFDESVNTVRSSNLIFEILPKYINKGTGLLHIARENGVRKDDIISIGDELNDIPMFNVSGIKIAMGNGNSLVKQKSDFITGTNNNLGISEAINWILNETV